MRLGRRLALAVICAVALLGTAAGQLRAEAAPLLAESTAEATAPGNRILRNRTVGFRLMYPRSWHVVRQVVATEFAVGAACRSVQVIDFRPPPGSGPGAQVLQSFVQICWKRLSGGESLAEFIEKTYGRKASSLFERTELSRVPAYRTKGDGLNATIFLQTDAHRLQIVVAVVAAPKKRALRQAQVQRILASFDLTS
jgi:hypothetical protein